MPAATSRPLLAAALIQDDALQERSDGHIIHANSIRHGIFGRGGDVHRGDSSWEPSQSSTQGSYCSCIAKALYRFFTYHMQWYSDDDEGVPACCRNESCLLSHSNKYFSTENFYMNQLGEIGYPYFDKERKLYQGIASFVSFLAIGFTLYGCLALSKDFNVVRRTYWAAGRSTNTTSGEHFSIYMGLRSMWFVHCEYVPGYLDYDERCYKESILWTADGCSPEDILNPTAWLPASTVYRGHSPILQEACKQCADITTSLWATACITCATLVLALLGSQVRMRVRADSPMQKLLGMVTDSWGALTLMIPLIIFEDNCYAGIAEASADIPDLSAAFWMGPGYACYVICCIAALTRAIVHCLTPLPGMGSGILFIFSNCCGCGWLFSKEVNDSDADYKHPKAYESPSPLLTPPPSPITIRSYLPQVSHHREVDSRRSIRDGSRPLENLYDANNHDSMLFPHTKPLQRISADNAGL